jgi:VIT1/CCC1 family predicted Fe2+/Mn2+ transporter
MSSSVTTPRPVGPTRTGNPDPGEHPSHAAPRRTRPTSPSGPAPSADSPGELSSRLNALRAGVLGANDGIVSTAAVVVGVAGASTAVRPILIAGLVAALGGAISMALGEYVSVSSQRDALRARASGRSASAHGDGDPQDEGADDGANPWQAAIASLGTFLVGAALPMLAILLPPAALRVPVTVVVVLVALAATGAIAAWIGGAPRGRAALRVVIGGAIALAVTYGLGVFIGGGTA